ncbi:MAG: GGDEF domain-containing protein [Brevinema sp.]
MKILLISEDNNAIVIVKKMSKKYTYKLKITPYNDISKYLDKTVESAAPVKNIFKISYDLIILDTKALVFLKEKNILFNDDDISLYPMLLLVEDFKNLDLELALKLRIFNTISLTTLTEDELHANLVLLRAKYCINKKASTWALMDSLTNIFNRRTFYNYLSKCLCDYKMHNTPLFCVAVLDIDHFKFINDTFGHNAGDEVLKVFARIISQKTRDTDIVARVGGEEFAIIFPNTSRNLAYKILERIRESMLHTEEIAEYLKVTFSAGLVEADIQSSGTEELLGIVDLLLYKAKDMGRDKICF